LVLTVRAMVFASKGPLSLPELASFGAVCSDTLLSSHSIFVSAPPGATLGSFNKKIL
jgi:hypothetical protein